jgi:hypothetical protein
MDNSPSSTTFELRYNRGCNDFYPTFCYSQGTFMILDGDYTSVINESGSGFPFEANPTPNKASELANVLSGTYGDITELSSGTPNGCDSDGSQAGLYREVTCTIDANDWTNAQTDKITLLFMINKVATAQTSLHDVFEPRLFTITGAPIQSPLIWDWPETPAERINFVNFGGNGTQLLNGTQADYGYYFSINPNVPDPPVNLIAVIDSADIDLSWTAPIFVGYDPITGYKIERESPIGGGFTTIVGNTFSTSTTYTDNTITPGQEYNYRVRALNSYGESLPSNESKDGVPSSSVTDPTPNVNCDGDPDIFSLIVAAVTQTSATLCWNGDILQTVNRTGFQVNFTTPWGEPLTVVNGLNNTGSNATTRLIENLDPGTQYSFRVHSWFNGSTGYNITNIANTTTLPGGLSIGDLVFDTSPNTDIFGYEFVRAGPCWDGFTALGIVCPNGTATYLYVNYPQTYNTTCNFEMKFARTNQTFSNLSTQDANGVDRVFANFTFMDLKNEVVTVDCWDEDSDATGKYLLTQTSFPLLTQMDQFRDGTFGTQGEFGAFDMITLIVVIVSMIGFNRVHTAVGAVFSMIIIGVAAYFGIIQWYSALFGIVAVVTMVAIVSNRKGGE